MCKKAAILILLLVLVLTSGCIEVEYQAKIAFRLGNPSTTNVPTNNVGTTPAIVGNSRFYHANRY